MALEEKLELTPEDFQVEERISEKIQNSINNHRWLCCIQIKKEKN